MLSNNNGWALPIYLSFIHLVPNEKNKALAQFDGMKTVPRLMPVALICFVLWPFMLLNTLAVHGLFFQSSMPLFSNAVIPLLNAAIIYTERQCSGARGNQPETEKE
jgi:hypothetical protein